MENSAKKIEVSVRKINNKNGRLFNNHKVFIDGVHVGNLGLACKDVDNLSFFDKGHGFLFLEALNFRTVGEFKKYMKNLNK